MSNRSIKMIREALKKAPKKVNVAKVKAAVKEVSLPDAMQRAQQLLGDVKLEERRPAFFEGFAYIPLKSKIAFGEDGKLYGDRFTSTAFFYGAKRLYVYARTMCYDTDLQEETFADFRYQDVIGVELNKTLTPYLIYTKKSEKEHVKNPSAPLQDESTGIAVPVIKIILRTRAGERAYYLNGDADNAGAVEAFVKELRAVIDAKIS